MAKNVLTQSLSKPIGGAKTARVHIDVGDGNLTIDSLTGGEPELASGTLEYLEGQEPPLRSVETNNGQVNLTLRASRGKQPWLRLPWTACNGATTWQVHLNPDVPADINARSNGGNIQLDLASMQVACVTVDNGGGNVEIVLPERAANLDVTAKTGGGGVSVDIGSLTGENHIEAGSGAGNVAIRLPGRVEARIHAESGLGKVIVDSGFKKIGEKTYQSEGYDEANTKVTIKATSGAGNVTISTR